MLRAILVFALAFTALAQTSTSLLSGTVFDSSGAVVTGASVTAIHENTGTTLKQTTNTAGLYAFPSIPVGPYTIVAEAPGFRTARQTGNTLVVGTPLTVNLTLQVGSATDVVNEEAAVEQINTANATLGNVVEQHNCKGAAAQRT
jgi:hypothetical protein